MKAETLTLFADEFAWPEDEVVEELIRSAAPTAKVGQCRYCLCPESEHEHAGESSRSSMKFVPGVAATGHRKPFVGSNRYCHSPLCSCIHYHHAHCACVSRLKACTHAPGGDRVARQ